MSTVKVKLPNGQKLTADVGGIQSKGYRTASVRVADGFGNQVRIAGRVTTRHGLDRTLPFEVNMSSVNATYAFDGAEDDVYAS